MASTVKINSVQAIDYIEIDMPEGEGGIRILRGSNGAGKTTAIACVNALLGRKVSLSVADGAPKGSIEGLGVKREIKQRSRNSGDLEVSSLEGRFDFSDLVDPPIKDPAARTKSRIRSLVGLTASKCTPEHFHELFGGEDKFDGLVDAAVLDGITDPVDLADKVKSQVQAAARELEAAVEDETSRWQIAVEKSKGVKPDEVPPKVADLATAYAKAKDEVAQAMEQNRNRADAIEANQETKAKLEEHAKSEPQVAIKDMGDELKSFDSKIEQVEKQLEQLRKERQAVQDEFNAARQWSDRKFELERMLREEPAEVPNVDDLEQAEQSALDALNNAEESKEQHEAAIKAKQLRVSIQENTEQAKQLRELAAKTSEVVTAMLPKQCPLQFRDGSLKFKYPGRRKWIDFDELSEGERWEIALGVAIESVGEGGVIPCSQEAWQSLDTESREAVGKMCADAKVYLITGEVGDGPLRVESL